MRLLHLLMRGRLRPKLRRLCRLLPLLNKLHHQRHLPLLNLRRRKRRPSLLFLGVEKHRHHLQRLCLRLLRKRLLLLRPLSHKPRRRQNKYQNNYKSNHKNRIRRSLPFLAEEARIRNLRRKRHQQSRQLRLPHRRSHHLLRLLLLNLRLRRRRPFSRHLQLRHLPKCRKNRHPMRGVGRCRSLASLGVIRRLWSNLLHLQQRHHRLRLYLHSSL